MVIHVLFYKICSSVNLWLYNQNRQDSLNIKFMVSKLKHSRRQIIILKN